MPGEIRYYRKEGQVCKCTGIVDMHPGLTAKDMEKLNRIKLTIGSTHWQVKFEGGNETVIMPLNPCWTAE